MARFLLLNGPNLNLIGRREPEVYGTRRFDELLEELHTAFPGHQFELRQSNVEGTLIDLLQQADGAYAGIVFNPAGFSHTSVAIRDALAALRTPVVEVHISNIHAREEFRERSLTAPVCAGVISGLGLDGYRLAVDHLLRRG
ncbi:MAG: type II 3-dehydroquinate dehydratase [Flavobacteriales bacterium]